jgi:hypothetical protein
MPDEHDEDDQSVVTWQFPGALEQPLPEPEEIQKTNGNAEREGEWEDVDDDDDDDDEDDEGEGFDARYDQSIKEKMDECNSGYYKVRLPCFFLSFISTTNLCIHYRHSETIVGKYLIRSISVSSPR